MAKKSFVEIGATRSSAKKDAHQVLIQKLESGGYTIKSQDENEEMGLDNELISLTLETILNPPNTSLPFIKLKAKEIFGHYDENEEVFEQLESPKFELSAYKKGAGLHDRNDTWDKFDLN